MIPGVMWPNDGIARTFVYMLCRRGVTGGWAGWPIAHSDFDRIEGDAGQLLCNSHYAIGTLMQFWVLFLY